MFAIFKHRWLKSRPLYWAGLFVFEFIVVLLGVLVAQSLQERFENRREAERFETTQAVINEQIVNSQIGILSRGLQSACIRTNLATIREAVRNREAGDFSAIAGHPPHPPTSVSVWNGETAREARRYLAPEYVQMYDYLATVGAEVTAMRRLEEEWWASIMLAADGGANLTDAERTEVILASYKLDHAFEGWNQSVGPMLGRLWYLGLEPHLDVIEAMHQGDGVCAEQVRGYLPDLREGWETMQQQEPPVPGSEAQETEDER